MENYNIRKPAVAGQFYPSEAKKLKKQIEFLIDKEAVVKDAIGCVMPHAGYMYSGGVAAKTASHITIKDKVIILGPNHTGYGKSFGIMTEGVWNMPFGDVKIDSDFASKLKEKSSYLEEDAVSHLYEHSLEVELPFLQYFKNDLKIVPITISLEDFKLYKALGIEIGGCIQELNLAKSVLIIASSDMTHYEPQGSAEKKDGEAIKAILELNEDKLIEVINRLNISMCGYAAVTVMLVASKLLGAKKAELIDYQTSGDITGDYSSVVGYAGIAIY
jgi:AmmeMemoRadiSam system protein B